MIELTSPTIGASEIRATLAVLRSKHLDRGAVTYRTEAAMRRYFGATHALLVSNGTAGLIAGLSSCGVGPGDEVITSPFSFIATVNAILLIGATPVFADISPDTYAVIPSHVKRSITKKTKAILAVDLYGQPADYPALKTIASAHHLKLISDSCQSIGATISGKPIHHFTDLSVFSFYNSKNIVSGEGGLLLTDNLSIAQRASLLINQGQKRGEKFNFQDIGWNFRPTEIQSAIIGQQLRRLSSITAKRKANAARLSEALKNTPGVITPTIHPHTSHAFSRYTLRITKNYALTRQDLQTLLTKKGIRSEIAYPKVLYSYSHISRWAAVCPNAETAANEVLSIPIHQNLTNRELDFIATNIRTAGNT